VRLSTHVEDKVTQFYECGEISGVMRGEEDFKRDVKRMNEQKSLILGSHGNFKSDCPEVKVASRSFIIFLGA
jgi:hypothetical protein